MTKMTTEKTKAALMMRECGCTVAQVAEIFGVGYATISRHTSRQRLALRRERHMRERRQ